MSELAERMHCCFFTITSLYITENDDFFIAYFYTVEHWKENENMFFPFRFLNVINNINSLKIIRYRDPTLFQNMSVASQVIPVK